MASYDAQPRQSLSKAWHHMMPNRGKGLRGRNLFVNKLRDFKGFLSLGERKKRFCSIIMILLIEMKMKNFIISIIVNGEI